MTNTSQLQQMLQNLQKQVNMVEAYAKPYLMRNQQFGVTTDVTSQTQNSKQDDEQSNADQLVNLPMTIQQEMLLTMYNEFANTDDGKQLASNLSKFARFVQSKVAKS